MLRTWMASDVSIDMLYDRVSKSVENAQWCQYKYFSVASCSEQAAGWGRDWVAAGGKIIPD